METPEEKLLDAMGGESLTPEEAAYLAWLLPRTGSTGFGKFTIEQARRMFDKKFPNSKWR